MFVKMCLNAFIIMVMMAYGASGHEESCQRIRVNNEKIHGQCCVFVKEDNVNVQEEINKLLISETSGESSQLLPQRSQNFKPSTHIHKPHQMGSGRPEPPDIKPTKSSEVSNLTHQVKNNTLNQKKSSQKVALSDMLFPTALMDNGRNGTTAVRNETKSSQKVALRDILFPIGKTSVTNLMENVGNCTTAIENTPLNVTNTYQESGSSEIVYPTEETLESAVTEQGNTTQGNSTGKVLVDNRNAVDVPCRHGKDPSGECVDPF